MSTAFKSVSSAADQRPPKTIPEVLEKCYSCTAEALSILGLASEDQIETASERVWASHEKGIPADFLEAVARAAGHEEEQIGGAISTFSEALAYSMNPRTPTIPFASKLIAPSAFYESFEAIHQLARALLVPILYAEDTDAIGVGSINPIACVILGAEVHQAVGRRFSIHPFQTCVRMDYESWAFLCRKHFEL